MNWDEFHAEYAKQLRAMAFLLRKKFHAPAGVSAEDIEQEMLLSTWVSFMKYDPTRGNMPIQNFAVMSAKHHGIRVLNEQRNAVLRDSKAPSRVPVSFSELGVDQIDVEENGRQHDAAVFLQAMDRMLNAARSDAEKSAIRSWVESGFDDEVAAEKIGDMTKAKAVVNRAKKAVTEASK